MKDKTIFQTLKYKNISEIELKGPFPCSRKGAWLGEGYYFWDTFIEHAEWWGKSACKGNYVVCQAECDFDEDLCFDLYGVPEYIEQFRKAVEIIKRQLKLSCSEGNITVAQVISFLKEKEWLKKFEAIRISSIKKNSYNNTDRFVKFNKEGAEYFDTQPLIQICLFEKTGMNLRNYRIVKKHLSPPSF